MCVYIGMYIREHVHLHIHMHIHIHIHRHQNHDDQKALPATDASKWHRQPLPATNSEAARGFSKRPNGTDWNPKRKRCWGKTRDYGCIYVCMYVYTYMCVYIRVCIHRSVNT